MIIEVKESIGAAGESVQPGLQSLLLRARPADPGTSPPQQDAWRLYLVNPRVHLPKRGSQGPDAPGTRGQLGQERPSLAPGKEERRSVAPDAVGVDARHR